jgi:hypothetical protein
MITTFSFAHRTPTRWCTRAPSRASWTTWRRRRRGWGGGSCALVRCLIVSGRVAWRRPLRVSNTTVGPVAIRVLDRTRWRDWCNLSFRPSRAPDRWLSSPRKFRRLEMKRAGSSSHLKWHFGEVFAAPSSEVRSIASGSVHNYHIETILILQFS